MKLNEEITIVTDVQYFLCNDFNAIDSYSGEFLHGFYVKQGQDFQQWVNIKRREDV